MRVPACARFLALCLSLLFARSVAEQYEYDVYDYDNAYNNDEGADADYADGSQYQNYASVDGIKYWTNYAIKPMRCIVYNNVDMIVFQMYNSNYCSDSLLGTYVTPVPEFVNGYLQEKQQQMQDMGADDYEFPDVSQYTSCTPFQIQGVYYYFQMGCADDSSRKLAVNIYSDKDCTTRSAVDGYDDSNIDVSDIRFPFQQCKSCVNWVDGNGNADDQFYENNQMNAPFCKSAWSYKETCGRRCKRIGKEESVETGWNTSDKALLFVLTAFACIMVGVIVRKRQKMSNKDALLEQAAMNAAGLQQPHVIGVCVLVVMVVAVFALLGLKNITWALLLIINTVLFSYLMKLTLDSGVGTGETVIGPDGTIMRKDSDDSSLESSRPTNPNNNTYMLPTLT